MRIDIQLNELGEGEDGRSVAVIEVHLEGALRSSTHRYEMPGASMVQINLSDVWETTGIGGAKTAGSVWTDKSTREAI